MLLTVYIPFKDPDVDVLSTVIEAVLNQTVELDELLLVDDGSQRKIDLSNFTKTNKRIRIVSLKQNMGVAAARNTAVREAKGQLLASFDADIVPNEDCLEKLLQTLNSEVNILGVGGRVREKYTTELGDKFRQEYMKQDRGDIRINDIDLFGGCTIYRLEALIKAKGYFSPLRNSFEDFDISRRVRNLGGTTVYEPKACGYHYKRDTVHSALDTLYRWSFPHWEDTSWVVSYDWLNNPEDKIPPINYYEEIVAKDLTLLAFKAKQDLVTNQDRIKSCSMNPESRLLLLTFSFRSILNDFSIWATLNLQKHPTDQVGNAQEFVYLVLTCFLTNYVQAESSVRILEFLDDRLPKLEIDVCEIKFENIYDKIPDLEFKETFALYIEEIVFGLSSVIECYSKNS